MYHRAIDILESEFPTFERVCTELKIEGFPVTDSGLPVLNLKHVPMESQAMSSGLPAGSSDTGTSSDAKLTIDALNNGFGFELGETSGIGLTMGQVLPTELPMDLSDPTVLPAEPSSSTGLPAEPSCSTGLPAEPSSSTGLPSKQSSSTGLPERMDEDESEAKRPRLSVSGEGPSIFVKVNFS